MDRDAGVGKLLENARRSGYIISNQDDRTKPMTRRTLQGKRILLTGASGGIGAALATEAARRGSRLLLTGRDARRLQQTVDAVKTLGGEVHAITSDVTDPADRRRLIDESIRCLGGLDILVNNAGVGATGHFQYASADRLRQLMEVNFFAPCELTRLSIPVLKTGADPAIVMIGSLVGRRAMPARPDYAASKFALTGFSEALRAELAKDDIDVMVVTAGLIDTEFENNMIECKAKMSMNPQRNMAPAAAAAQIWTGLERGKNELVLTWKAKLLLLVNRIAPRFVDRRLAQKVRDLYAAEIAERKKSGQRPDP